MKIVQQDYEFELRAIARLAGSHLGPTRMTSVGLGPDGALVEGPVGTTLPLLARELRLLPAR